MRRTSETGDDDRARPRLWQYDYLLLHPLARDLKASAASGLAERGIRRVLDVGSGTSPYRDFFGNQISRYERLDVDPRDRPTVIGHAESMPFLDGSFDAVLSTQVLGLFVDPHRVAREISRIVRSGGRVWLSGPAAWPYDSATAEHRFGVPDLPRLFPEFRVIAVFPQGGMLTLPFGLLNVVIRETLIAAERRIGPPARLLRLPARAICMVSNLSGCLLELMARRGPFSRFLGYLHGRLPMNLLLVAEKCS